MRPLRATTATAPGNFFAWISPWRILPIRPSRSAERPTSSGRAEGSACAHTKEKETDSETTRTPRNRRMRASREERGCHFSRTIWKGRAGRLQNACSGRGVHRLEGPGALRVRRLLRTPQGAVELRLGSEPREHQSRSDDEMRRNGLSDSLEERLACLARASPEEDGLRIEQRGDGGDGRAQVRHHWPRGARQAALRRGTLERLCRAQLLARGTPHHLLDRPLPEDVRDSRRLLAARVARKSHLADFSGGEVHAAMDRAVQEHTGADSRAESQEDEVVQVPRGAEPLLAQGAAIRVTLDEHGDSIALLELRAARDVHQPVAIAGADDQAVGIDDTSHGT